MHIKYPKHHRAILKNLSLGRQRYENAGAVVLQRHHDLASASRPRGAGVVREGVLRAVVLAEQTSFPAIRIRPLSCSSRKYM